jgi:F-type H+-transporting ATPase subunit gamma
MANLKEIKRRITSVSSTQQITKAMKMVAAAKLRKAQEAISLARPYALSIQEVLAQLTQGQEEISHPLLKMRQIKTVCYVVVTGDRGLCGGFNSSTIKQTQLAINELPDSQKAVLYCIGKRGFDHFKSRDTKIVGQNVGFFNHLDFSDATSIGLELRQLFESGEIDSVVLIFNEFKSAIQQILHTDRLLPAQIEDSVSEGPQRSAGCIYEPNRDTLLDSLLPMYVNRVIWRVLLDSFAAEQGARMTAMESATENANEMIADLTLQYNRIRQAAITQEIAEIVGGAAAIQ